jgi:transcription factor C subunit 7
VTSTEDGLVYKALQGHEPRTGIPTDVELSSQGVDQAKDLANHLCSIEPPIDRIYSSPYTRCLQTLEPTTTKLFKEGKAGGKIRVEYGLGEFMGMSKFLHPTPPDLNTLKLHFENLDEEYESKHRPYHHGEFIQDLHRRVEVTIKDIIESLDKEPGEPKTLLICTHAAVMIALGRVLTGKNAKPDDSDEEDFNCYVASLSTFKRRLDTPGSVGSWDCKVDADTSFLKSGPQLNWYVFLISSVLLRVFPAVVHALSLSTTDRQTRTHTLSLFSNFLTFLKEFRNP